MAKYFRLLVVVLLFGSCTEEEIDLSSNWIEPIEEELVVDKTPPTLELDARLSIDNNGYYHLTLNQYSNQTIHRIDGKVLDIKEPTKVYFTSNLYWTYNGERIPTTNSVSYATPSDPNISNVIAPIYSMKNDTLTLNVTISEWKITQTLEIVLD